MHSKFSRLLLPTMFLTLCLPAMAQAQYAYDIVSLGNVSPYGINNRGQVVGDYYTYVNQTYQYHAFTYQNGQTTDLFPFSASVNTSALSINDRGQITGANATGPYVYDSSTGMAQSLGLTTNSYAIAINQNGDVAGQYRYGGTPTGPQHAYIYSSSAGQFKDINQIGGLGGNSQADAINNVGQASGSVFVFPGQVHAFVYSNGVMQDIGTLPNCDSAQVTSMNDSGDVIGYSSGFNISTHAFLYHNGQMQDLGAQISPGSISFADGINNAGDIVGQYGQGGFLYHNGAAQSLNSLIDPSLGWNITGATAINDEGQIIGSGNLGGFIMTPHIAATPAPGSLLTFGVGSVVLLLAARRRKRIAA